MKKIGDLMADLGFREDAPDSVKKAFIESLTQSLAIDPAAQAIAAGSLKQTEKPTEKSTSKNLKALVESARQLSFFETNEPTKKPGKPRAG